MNTQSPQKPGAPQKPGQGGMVNDPKDPTQQMPAGEGITGEDRAILDQQHTGNHQKPGQEQGGADRFGGTRAGAENVEPRGGQGKDRQTG
ncbi:MAG TPA: hypothetical protein VEB20_02040 [Azospirillaceae bacterium]|nr:hypothetical protein [Azospirillaceae bacterium]